MNSSLEISDAPAQTTALRQQVSIVIPLYNESEAISNLRRRLEPAQTLLDKLDLEFVLVDDGSSDDTFEKTKELFADMENVRVITCGENRGVMGAIMFGLNEASHDIVCSMDSDCTYAPEDICKLVESLSDDVTMVVGSPYHPDAKVHNVPKWRIFISKSASRIYRWLLRTKLNCYTSCFRAYRKNDIENIELQRTGFEGTVELVWAVERHDLKTVECPADLSVREFGQSSSRLLPITLRHLSLIKSIAFHRVFG